MRELKNFISRTLIRSESREGEIHLEAHHFDKSLIVKKNIKKEYSDSTSLEPLRVQVDDFQRETILKSVKKVSGNWSQAAKMLGINRSNLYNLAKRLGIK